MMDFKKVYRLIKELKNEIKEAEQEYWADQKKHIMEIAGKYNLAVAADDFEDPEDVRQILLDDGDEIIDDLTLAMRLADRYWTFDELDAYERGEDLPEDEDRDIAKILKLEG